MTRGQFFDLLDRVGGRVVYSDAGVYLIDTKGTHHLLSEPKVYGSFRQFQIQQAVSNELQEYMRWFKQWQTLGTL